MSTPMTITARLTTAVVGMERNLILDGPLTFTWMRLARQAGRHVPPPTDAYAADAELPFEKWDIDGVWGWCVSRAEERVIKYTTVESRRKPAIREMSLLTAQKTINPGVGNGKARNAIIPARLTTTMRWHALVTDLDELGALLEHTPNISAQWRNGFGHVSSWTIERSENPKLWMNRPLPSPDGTLAPIRPPYWHRSRYVPCKEEKC